MADEITKYQTETTTMLARRKIYAGIPDDDVQLALAVCAQYNLDPLLKHVVLIKGRGKGEGGQWTDVYNIYITRDGLLHVAHQSGIPFSVTPDEPELKVNPYTGKDDIYLSGTLHRAQQPDWHGGLWLSEYRQLNKEGRPIGAWGTHPAAMHAKVLEVYLLRRGFDVSLPAYEEVQRVVDDADVVDSTVTELPQQGPQPRQEAEDVDSVEKTEAIPSTSIMPPEQCIEYLRGKSAELKEKYDKQEPTTNQFTLFTGMLSRLTGSDDPRRITWCREVFGIKSSTQELKRRNIEATLNYLAPEKGDDGKYHITNDNAQEEFDLIVNAAIQREAVGELPGIDD